ncbi:uncharacterized protein BDZ99DRAFT_298985 [Mytilinidion resinicola]|uniref:Uncharacterized protein n=1 Tax=Mytilinidion resinicola TaxID=574789 RepID=A0A6A6YTK3_9PEZI|nr:uncharacterized protein BDZ99DRAFT_298985 [Mytilinidion resinicola]KAF2811295.1 hypothetical protein BDZ99DRAFT_298985 [Mytilinidion resinicola]
MGIPAWRSRKPLVDPAGNSPGRSLREIQDAFRSMDMREPEQPRRAESPLDFGLGEYDQRSATEDEPAPESRASAAFQFSADFNFTPNTVTNRIPSAPDSDWNQVPLGLYFETMTHLVDRTLIHSEIRTALHSKRTGDERPTTNCDVSQAAIDSHLAGEAEAIGHRFSAQIAGSIIQRMERMICLNRRRVNERSAWVQPRPQLKTLKEIIDEVVRYLDRAKEQRVEAGESAWHVAHELTWVAWVQEAVHSGTWHLAEEREECECLGVAVYEVD